MTRRGVCQRSSGARDVRPMSTIALLATCALLPIGAFAQGPGTPCDRVPRAEREMARAQGICKDPPEAIAQPPAPPPCNTFPPTRQETARRFLPIQAVM